MKSATRKQKSLSSAPAPYPTRAMKELFEAILSLESPHEASLFFRDLLTPAEINEFANRWQMVKLLLKGRPYTEIASKLETSTATVTRVAHWLFHGMGGYQRVADKVLLKKSKDSLPEKAL